ncbi:MAG: response regulator [Polyangiales bacterium]
MAPRVLVVDDSATLRAVMGDALRAAGVEVEAAVDGADALEHLQRAPFDALVTDFVMPRVNGYQLVQAVRASPALRGLPVVLVSAKAEAIGERFVAQTGAVAALAKPFTPDALREAVSRALGARWSPVPAEASPDDPFAGMIAELEDVISDAPPAPGPLPALASSAPGGAAGTAVHRAAQRPPAVPSAAVVEAAHARFTELLARELTPAFQDVAGGGPQVTEDAVVQVIRFYLSAAKVAALARELRPLEAGLRGSVVLDGLVEAVPLGEVFQLLAFQAQTGALTVERGADAGGGSVRFGVRGGRVDLALASELPREFLLGRYLVEAGVVSRAHVDAVVASLEPHRMLLGAALVTGGFITEGDLAAALQRQTAELVYEVLRWPVGRFRFEAGAALPEAQLARLGLPSEPMVLEGYRRLDEWRVIGDYLPGAASVLARLDAPHGAALEGVERRVLEAVDGRRTAAEVADALAMSSFDACKALCRLLQGRLVALAA